MNTIHPAAVTRKRNNVQKRVDEIRAEFRPMTPAEIEEEVKYTQEMIDRHGIDAFRYPAFMTKVQMVMAMGYTITLPSDEEFQRIAAI